MQTSTTLTRKIMSAKDNFNAGSLCQSGTVSSSQNKLRANKGASTLNNGQMRERYLKLILIV